MPLVRASSTQSGTRLFALTGWRKSRKPICDEVWLEGNLRTKQWADKEGKERKTTQLRVTGMRMLRQAPDKDRVQQTINTLSAIIELLKKPQEEVKLTNEEIAHMVDLARGNLMV